MGTNVNDDQQGFEVTQGMGFAFPGRLTHQHAGLPTTAGTRYEKFIGRKKANLWPIPLFYARKPKFRQQGESTRKNVSSHNFSDSKSQLTDRRPFAFQK